MGLVEPFNTNLTDTGNLPWKKKRKARKPEDLKEGENLFHSQMWVKGSPLQFIVDSWS